MQLLPRKSQDATLIILPCWGIDSAPLGLACLAAYCRQKGRRTKVLDLNIEIFHRVSAQHKELWQMKNSHLWWELSSFNQVLMPVLAGEIEWAAQTILENAGGVIGFSVYAPNRFFTIEVMKAIRRQRPEAVIVVGGRGVNDARERALFGSGLADYFVVGEGEEPFESLLKGEKNIRGVINVPEKEMLPVFANDLSAFPAVNYEEFDLGRYTQKKLCLLMSRGCIFECAFCNDWRSMGKPRSRRPQDIYEEIAYHVEKNAVTEFFFNDQAINVNPAALQALCDLLIKAPFTITWVALAIPWRFLTFELLEKMKRAGCFTLNYGIESGSDRVLRLMKKKFTVAETEAVLADTRRAGINTQLNFIVGFPGEQEEDFIKTKEYIKRNRADICGITNLNMCNAVLGSDLVMDSGRYGILFPEDAGKSDTHWYSADGSNTPALRYRRLKELLELVEGERLAIFTTNASGG